MSRLTSLPTHVIENIAGLLSTRNLAQMAQMSAPAATALARRRAEVEAELRWWARQGAQLVRLPFRAAVARVEALASGNTARRRGVRVVETSRRSDNEATALEFRMYGSHFAVEYDVSEVHSRPGRPKHEFTIAPKTTINQQGGKHVTLRRDLTTRDGSSRAHTVVKNLGFPQQWVKMVREIAKAK